MIEKFGIPRQSGLADGLKGKIIFEEKYSDPKAVEGLEGYDYLWLIWKFEDVGGEKELGDERPGFRAQIRPPRLGGNKYVGVFASRSPFRPNPLGLSCVKLDGIEYSKELGPILHVSGVDLRDNTPIFDIKPYVPYADAHPDARGGFTDWTKDRSLAVDMSRLSELIEEGTESVINELDEQDLKTISQLLAQDPRPAYHNDCDRIYGMRYKNVNVRFQVADDIAYVLTIEKI